MSLKNCVLISVFQLLLIAIPFVECQETDASIVDSLRGEVEQLRRELGESRSTAERFQNAFDEERKNLNDWRDRSNQFERFLQEDRERLRTMNADLDRANQELGVERENNQSLRTQTEEQAREVQRAQERISQIEAKNRELENVIASNSNEQESAKMKDELEKALAENQKLLIDVESLEKDLNAKIGLLKEAEDKLSVHAEKLSSLENVESELERAKERINELLKSKKQTANILEETKTQMKTSKDTLFQVRRELTGVKAELSQYKDEEAFWPKVWNLVREEIVDFGQRLFDTAEPIVGDLRPYFKQAYYQVETGLAAAMTLLSSVFEEIMVALPGLWQQAGGDVITEQIVEVLEEVDYFKYHNELVQSMQKVADTVLDYVKIEKAPKYVLFVVEKWHSNCEGVAVFLEAYVVVALLVLIYITISRIIHLAFKPKSHKMKME